MPAPPSDMDPGLADLSGTVLESRYQLGRVLGAGGMGAVFEAIHLLLDRPVAIKVLRPRFVGHHEFVRRFLREAKAASKIRHRNVVEVLDYGEAPGGLVYSVMELLHGQDLDRLLHSRPDHRLPWAQARGLLIQIAAGLRAAHSCGVIHRDIKPANCFLTQEDGEPLVKVVDFGIAKLDEGDNAPQLTGTAEVLGTPAYIAPELVRTRSPADPRSDVYSFGVLAYRMLSGRVPFEGETAFAVLHQSCFEPVPPLRDRVPELPSSVEAFVLSMLAKDPRHRPQDMHAVREGLMALGQGTPEAERLGSSTSSALVVEAASESMESRGAPMVPTTMDTAKWVAPKRASVVHPARTEIAPIPLGLTHGPPATTGMAEQVDDHTTSDPPPQGATLPGIPNETQPRVDGLLGLHRQSRFRKKWAIIGTLGVALFAVALSLTMATYDVPPTSLHLEAKPEQMPESHRLATEPATRLPLPAPEPRSSSEEHMSPTPTQAETTLVQEPPPPLTVPEPGEELVDPHQEATPKPSTEHKPATTKRPTQAIDSKPSGPPSDARMLSNLRKNVKAQCSDAMSGASLTISFIVRSDGRVTGLLPSKDAALKCATQQIKDAVFRKRSDPTPIELKVP